MCVFVCKRVYVCVRTCVELVGERTREIEYTYTYMYSYTYIYRYIYIYLNKCADLT